MNILNSLSEGLNNLDRTLNNKSSSSFVSNFLNELKDHLEKSRSYELFKQLPEHTHFHLTGYNNNFLEVMAYKEKALYYIPKNVIVGDVKLGEALSFISPNKLAVNYGGIPLWEDEISKFKNQCTIAK